MGDYRQRSGNRVTAQAFYDDMPFCATAADLREAVEVYTSDDPEDIRARRSGFMLRILDPDHTTALDSRVRLVNAEPVAEPDKRAVLRVSLHTVLLGGGLGPADFCEVDQAGVHPDKDAQDWDAGYFFSIPQGAEGENIEGSTSVAVGVPVRPPLAATASLDQTQDGRRLYRNHQI